MKFNYHLLLVFCFFPFLGNAQSIKDSVVAEIMAFQHEQNTHFSDRKASPLKRDERRKFKGHRFYPINLDYVVTATFVKINAIDTIEMNTSRNEIKYYQPYAKVYFKLNNEPCELTVYQSLRLREIDEYKDHLLIPFRDATSGKSSYGGGRYIDMTIPTEEKVILNFNLAYNPYCAYTTGYNCVIPPAENTLKVEVRAGAMTPDGH